MYYLRYWKIANFNNTCSRFSIRPLTLRHAFYSSSLALNLSSNSSLATGTVVVAATDVDKLNNCKTSIKNLLIVEIFLSLSLILAYLFVYFICSFADFVIFHLHVVTNNLSSLWLRYCYYCLLFCYSNYFCDAIDSEIGEMLNYAKIEWHLEHRYVYALIRYEFKKGERGRRQRKIEKKNILHNL